MTKKEQQLENDLRFQHRNLMEIINKNYSEESNVVYLIPIIFLLIGFGIFIWGIISLSLIRIIGGFAFMILVGWTLK